MSTTGKMKAVMRKMEAMDGEDGQNAQWCLKTTMERRRQW